MKEGVMCFFGTIRSRAIPRCAAIILALAGLLVLPGCWVESINPLYEDGFLASKDTDVIVDQRLTGSWITAFDEKCTLTLTVSAKDDTYDLESTQQGPGCDDEQGKKSRQQARLVKLDTHVFLDVSPMPDDVCEMCLAKHTIYLAKIDKDSFSLAPIDSEWVKNALEQKKVSLATLPDDSDVLIAVTKDLKAFCSKYADDPAVFKPIGLAFKRK
jgi:hypothetical protein